MGSVYLTTQFRVYNPSRRKRAILERAMRIYASAYAKLLELAREKESEIEAVCRFRESISAKKISDYLSMLFRPYAGSFPIHSSMRDSLYQDVARNLASYFELKEKIRRDSEIQPPSWPTIACAEKDKPDRSSEYTRFLDKLCEAENVEEIRAIESSIRHVMTQREPMRIFFCRADGNIYPRNFGLFYEPDTDVFWARVFLLNSSECRKNPTQGHKRRLIPISKEKREIELRAGGASYLLLPLECGEWQRRKFLLPLLDNPSMVRTATLCKKGDEFYLHVAFEFGSPKPIEPTSVLAVTLSNTSFVEVTVTDMQENEIISRPIPYDTWWEEQKRQREVLKRARAHGENLKLYFKRINDNIVHMLANKIVETAQEYKSQVVMLKAKMEKADPNAPGRKRRAINYILHRRPYSKLEGMLAYKLPLAGLPGLQMIYPWKGMLRQCLKCGREASENGVICVCGNQVRFDEGRALKTARRWLDLAGKKAI